MFSPALRENRHYQPKQNTQKNDKNMMMKINVPLSMSRVSMQDDPDKKVEAVHENIKRGLSFVEQSNNNTPTKIERSRTFANSGRFRTRGQKVEAMLLNNSPKITPDLIPSAVSIDKSSISSSSILGNKDSPKPIVNDLPINKSRQFNISDSRITEKVHTSSSQEKLRGSMERNHSTLDSSKTPERVQSSNYHKPHIYQDKVRHSLENKSLPKPKPPSQQYLMESSTNNNAAHNGSRSLPNNTLYGSHSLPSPRTSKEISRDFDHHDPDWLTRR